MIQCFQSTLKVMLKGWLKALKTIREIAEMVGVSKTAIYSLIKTHDIPTVKKKNTTYIDENELSLILAHYSNAQHDTIKDIIQDSINIDSKVENAQIIDILEKQLDEKQEIIRGLLKTIANEQQLRAVPLLLDKQTTEPRQNKLKNFFWNMFKKIEN